MTEAVVADSGYLLEPLQFCPASCGSWEGFLSQSGQFQGYSVPHPSIQTLSWTADWGPEMPMLVGTNPELDLQLTHYSKTLSEWLVWTGPL